MRASDFVWLVGSLCGLHGLPFDTALLTEQYPPPHDLESLRRALSDLGLDSHETAFSPKVFKRLLPPYVAFLRPEAGIACGSDEDTVDPALVTSVLIVQTDAERILFFRPGSEAPKTLSHAEFLARFEPHILKVERKPTANDELADPADNLAGRPAFGFTWFIPELMKHKRIWRDVLLASLAIWLPPSVRQSRGLLRILARVFSCVALLVW